ncbi:MAG: glycosyltransferase family 4 protein [Nanoarchaeota archaeon]|nr:glycosyltransferase family 4 protein [Nanoarchaeota archaeon]MBU1444776.1 glycosyltransferase family 4 protein [Nanoarchaeota archaeon]MBU2420064.1 glycosyltransferase family 4 protein [Nanoarchaeota archaeon]MBU2474905.1 glycosyltransferase family 4 protein [Nanoarchaeota archaeon]
MKILFLTRKYPPTIGGMENYSYNLVKYFKKINNETYLIANTKGNKFIPLFMFGSFFKALYLIWKNKITVLHLGDGMLAFEGKLIKKLTGVKTIITIHGLDITYKNRLYQKIIPKSINKLDKVICVSNNTKEQCIKRGITENKIVVLPNGINPKEFVLKGTKKELREKLSKKLNLKLENKKILLTTGRLVERKGVFWFVNEVMPKLSKDWIYLVSGEGEDRIKIEKSIKKNNLEKQVFLLGKTDFDTLKLLYNSADLFIMPNISVEGNIEGFGIVAIEAGSCGLPVITSGIEGIKDAIINGKTGYLAKEGDIKEFINKINLPSLNKELVKKTTKKNFDWERIIKEYKKVLE